MVARRSHKIRLASFCPAAILASLLFGAGGVQSAAAPVTAFIGIRLLDVPADRSDDPRAQLYIIDHLAPGARIRRHVEVSSTAVVPQAVEVLVGAASISGGSFIGAAGRNQNDLSSWMSLDHSSVTLAPHGSAPVEVTIQVPSRASAGERYAVIWAQVASPAATPGGVVVVNRVGVRVYLDVGAGGDPPSDFEIRNLAGARTTGGQPEVVALVENTGRRALDMRGELRLSDGPGSLSAGPFPAETGPTLAPGDSAAVRVLVDRAVPAGPWQAQLTLASGLLERTATATIRFPGAAGAEDAPVPPNGSEWISAILVVAGLLVGIALVVVATLSRRRQRRLATT